MLTINRPRGYYETIPTTTFAQRPPTTQVEYDAPVLAIRKARAEELYAVTEFPTDWPGRAFQLVKDRTGESYSVFVVDDGQNHQCDCRGFAATARCKHIDALRHLIEDGQLDAEI